MSQKSGELYGNFETIRVIGEGGMGTVYEARHTNIATLRTAIKVIRPDYAQIDAFRQLFEDEAKIMAQLGEHPGVVSIRDFGFNGGRRRDRLYIVMDFIEGENLGKRLRRLKENNSWIGLDETIWLIRQLCPALQTAHLKGICHLDLKPANIMLAEDPAQEFNYRPILMDFGIAQLKEAIEEPARRELSGTPPYMSPEQAGCGYPSLDGRSDIYSLGVMLFELATGAWPFEIKSLTEINKICHEEPRQPTTIFADLPTSLEEVILKAIQKDPQARFQTVTDLDEALSKLKPQIQTLPHISPGSTMILSLSSVDQLPAAHPKRILDPKFLLGPGEVEAVLEKMFPAETYEEVVIREQFNKGLSGAYVYEVRPVSHSTNEAHSVIKVAARSVILKEYQAYEQFLQKAETEKKLSLKCVKPIGQPIELPELGLGWAGLRYAMVGDGESQVDSLYQYYLSEYKTIAEALAKQRELLGQLHKIWRSVDYTPVKKSYSVRKHFSQLLPPDLVIDCSNGQLPDPAPPKIGSQPWADPFKIGDSVEVSRNEFIVVKIDPVNFSMALRSPVEMAGCYNLQLIFGSAVAMEPYKHYLIGERIPHTIQGMVTATRGHTFNQILSKTLGSTVNWAQDDYLAHPSLKTALPNPWRALEPTLEQFLDDVSDGVIHGDLNLENVLIEIPGDTLALIDFTHMRQDKVLHDFLTYETRILTKMVAELCRDEKDRLPKIIHDFYCRLDQETFKLNQSTSTYEIPEKLQKPFRLLVELREEAKSYITARSKDAQYYVGLTVYLLGAMKFNDLDELKDSQGRSIPKQAAFWAAATVRDLLQPRPGKAAPPSKFWTTGMRFGVGGAGLFALLSCALACLFLINSDFLQNLFPTPTSSPTQAIPSAPVSPSEELPKITPPAVTTATPIHIVAQEQETLILIFAFYETTATKTEPHVKIRRAIEATAAEMGLDTIRVEQDPTILNDDQEAEAKEIGQQYKASMVIWGEDTGVQVRVNFLNLKQPDFEVAQVKIQEDQQTQLNNPRAYSDFVVEDLPAQLTFLSFYTIGQSYYLNEQYDQAIAVVEQGVNSLPPGVQPEGLAKAYFRLGWLYQSSPPIQYAQVITYYTRAIEITPDEALIAYNNRGVTYYDQEQYELAIKDYTRAIELDPNYVYAYNNRGLTYYDQEQYEQAIKDYNRAIELDPNYVHAYNNRGRAYADQEQYEQAMKDYNRAIELDPNYVHAYNNRGNVYRDSKEYDKAIAEYNEAMRIDPEYALAYYNRGRAYDDQGQFEQALKDYNRAIELDPKYGASYFSRGYIYQRQKQYEQAMQDYGQAIKYDPEDTSGYNNLCWLGSLLGRAGEVISTCEQGIALDPKNDVLYDARGLARALTGDYQGAIEDFKIVVKWFNDNGLGEPYGSTRKAWIKALEAGENPFTEELLQELVTEDSI